MVFWRNSRYEEVEKFSSGDPMRGLPEQKFPWLLGRGTFLDDMADVWLYDFSCLSITPDKNKNRISADIIIETQTKITQDNLKKMGISSERLDAMGVNSWNYLEEKYSCQLFCEFEKIEFKAKIITDKFMMQINKKYNLEVKLKVLMNNIKQTRISGFSEEF